MTEAYRSPLNEVIDYDTWRAYCQSEQPLIEIIDYNGFAVEVIKQYTGTIKNVFKVSVNCSSDIKKYWNYSKAFEGNAEASNDFDRIVQAVQNDEAIFDLVYSSDDGNYVCKYSASEGFHLFINVGLYPVEALGYNTRTEAENKFNEITGQ